MLLLSAKHLKFFEISLSQESNHLGKLVGAAIVVGKWQFQEDIVYLLYSPLSSQKTVELSAFYISF